ncbi:GDP-fucose protein O-fucosyltransferase 2 isoform X2 [Athalia rosae]|nr:GDP-fucose protein O-fucosyltransferase 2 isoform X2 [Athalia rosae]XP_048513766.1 GDP-fucose protein O-fucosyltransferase 2 isoform X2 [Athalia rosae]
MRVAIFVKNLSVKDKRYDWHLVLPPWGNLYHWRSTDVGSQSRIPWSRFFDVSSLQKYVPAVELHDFLQEYPGVARIDRVYILQNDEDMFRTGKFEDKNQLIDCNLNQTPYFPTSSNSYTGRFWGHSSNITAADVKCLIFHGTMSDLKQNLYPDIYSSVMFDHMEIPLHDSYGSKEYWDARRSMRYSHTLYEIANEYRQTYLDSNDLADHTEQPPDWRKERERQALGGPYLCVHLRRRDFVTARRNTVPTIKGAASQLNEKMKALNLSVIFVATDAEDYEYNELKSYLDKYTVLKYSPSRNVRTLYKDGGIAIIDQIICSKARYFIGTHESTFTFRIQEDREIMGFPSETTFNRLCGKKGKCNSGGSWKIVWR